MTVSGSAPAVVYQFFSYKALEALQKNKLTKDKIRQLKNQQTELLDAFENTIAGGTESKDN